MHTMGPPGAGGVGRLFPSEQFLFYPSPFFFYRSQDGENWEKLPHENIHYLGISQGLMAGWQHYLSQVPGIIPGFVISTDEGLTWEERVLPPASVNPQSLEVTSEWMFVSDKQMPVIHKSPDSGLTWTAVPAPAKVSASIRADLDTLYTWIGSKVWMFVAGSDQWTEITPDPGNGEYVSAMRMDDARWIVSGVQSMYSSTNRGQTWEWMTDLPCNPFDEHAIVTAGSLIYFKCQAGDIFLYDPVTESWTLLPEPPGSDLNRFSLVHWDGWLTGIDYEKGICRYSPVAGDWQWVNDGLHSPTIYDLEQGEDEIWVATGDKVYTYHPVSGDWTDKGLPGSNLYYYSFVSHNQNMHVAVHDLFFKTYMSIDNGSTWKSLDVEGGMAGGTWIDDVLYLTTTSRLNLEYHTSNNQYYYYTEASLPVLFQGAHFATSEFGEILLSQDAGQTWQAAGASIDGMERLFATNDLLFGIRNINGKGYLYSSTDGLFWNYAHTGLPELEISFDLEAYSSKVKNASDRYFFHNPNIGLYESADQGQTWHPFMDGYQVTGEWYDDEFYFGGVATGLLKTQVDSILGQTMSGRLFLDSNGNGIWDPSEKALNGMKVERIPLGQVETVQFTYSQQDGSYRIFANYGNSDTLRPSLLNTYIQQIHPPHHLTNGSLDSLDFGIHLMPNVRDLSVSGTHIFNPRPGFPLNVLVVATNKGTVPVSGTLEIKLDPDFQFLSSDPPPDVVVGTDSLIWYYNQWEPLTDAHLWIYGQVNQEAILGDHLQTVVRIFSDQGDTLPHDNEVIFSDVIVGSYDPNDKSVSPESGLTKEEIAEGKELVYTIRFQNTGTYEADRVRITDQLDTALLLHTFRFVDASHPVTSVDLLSGGLLQVVFDDIALPDVNTNDPESHGFFQFAIQRKKFFHPDFKIHNTAAIFFDYNDPVITNRVTTTLYTPVVSVEVPESLSGSEKHLIVVPNPAGSTCRISLPGGWNGEGILYVRNSEGRQCLQMPWRGKEDKVLYLHDISSGVYQLIYVVKDGYLTGKLVVQK